MKELLNTTIAELNRLFRAKQLSPVEVAEFFIKRNEQYQKQLNVNITDTFDQALDSARDSEKRFLKDESFGILDGIVYGAKDIFCTEGIKTTCGSKIISNYIPMYESTVTDRLKKLGAPLVAKQNMDEFAMGSSTEHSAFGPAKNPWDTTRVPGGSSGGSAASVASGLTLFSIGTDTGGSIRQPASFCGVVGFKPSYGRISRFGMIAFASSLDQAGVLARSVEDAWIVASAISGKDGMDPTATLGTISGSLKQKDIKGVRIGVLSDLEGIGADKDIVSLYNRVLRDIETAGGIIVECNLPSLKYALPAYYVIAPSEASSNLARFDGIRYGFRKSEQNLDLMYKRTRTEGFGSEVKRRILIGTFCLSAGYFEDYFLKAAKARTKIIEEFNAIFEECDLLLIPTTPTVAFKLGEKINDPLEMYRSDILTVPASLAGLPAISLPAGTINSLPAGIQLIAKRKKDETLLAVSLSIEEILDFDRSMIYERYF